jgi:hypothetical protein
VFTQAVIEATPGDDGLVLPAADVFARLPVALLEAVDA